MLSPQAIFMLVTALLACTAIYLVRNAGRILGWYLRRKTLARRELILARVEAEQKAYPATTERPSPKSEDEEWEKVPSSWSKKPQDIKQGSENWEGIIGFFHPFW